VRNTLKRLGYQGAGRQLGLLRWRGSGNKRWCRRVWCHNHQ